MKAWHFVGKTLRDGSPVPADGVTLRFDGEPILCEQGYHWSRDPFDALQYAPGNILCLVEVGGTIIEASDKGVSTERTIIARIDATEMLRYFARMQALSVVHLIDSPPDVVLDYLMTGNASLQAAAWAAARDAARDAAWDASQAAAWAAARDAARAAAWDASQAAAWDAARDAAWDASQAAARNAAMAAARAAARAAAWAAARAAAWNAAMAAARSDFNDLVNECFSDFL